MNEYYCGMRIRADVVEAITAHARREQPRECCGILLGAADEVVEAVAAENVAAEPFRSYEVSPADHIAQIRRCRDTAAGGGGLNVIGVYHSHPHSAAVPSPTDLDQAYEEYVYLIAGPADDSAPLEIRAYRLSGKRFVDVPLTVRGGPDHLRQGYGGPAKL
jgi:proteasome lid subunit RPN8/RPN11